MIGTRSVMGPWSGTSLPFASRVGLDTGACMVVVGFTGHLRRWSSSGGTPPSSGATSLDCINSIAAPD